MGIALIKRDGTATLMAGGKGKKGTVTDYYRSVHYSEVIDGKKVSEYEDGVHEISEMPPEPGT